MIRRRLNQKKSRAAGILEFVLVLPFFLVLMLLVVDLGRAMMLHTEVNSALNATARIAAVQGGTEGLDGGLEGTFSEQYNPTSGVEANNITVTAEGASKICSPVQPYVNLKAEFEMELITPFLNQLIEGFSGEFAIGTTAIARCEVSGL
jgi:hypothetical protein